MPRTWLLILSFFLAAMPAFGQSTSTDSQTLQALLEEVRELRRDLQTTTAAAQKAHILIYRVQIEEPIVMRAQERAENTRSALRQIRFDQRKRADAIKQIEDRRSSNETPPTEQASLKEALTQLKAEYESSANDEQETQTRLIEAEEQLRIEQAKLSGFEDQLDRLEKAVANFDRSQH